jgi:hypothetical protein
LSGGKILEDDLRALGTPKSNVSGDRRDEVGVRDTGVAGNKVSLRIFGSNIHMMECCLGQTSLPHSPWTEDRNPRGICFEEVNHFSQFKLTAMENFWGWW